MEQCIHKTKEDFINAARFLIGKTIKKVEYHEIQYNKSFPSKNYYTHYKGIHSIDFSIVLYTFTNDTIEITWDSSFYQYGIGINIDRQIINQGFQNWDVSETEFWFEYIGKEILDVGIQWDEVITKNENNKDIRKYEYPQNIKLIYLANMSDIIISASQFLNESDKEVFGMSDNIVVTNNRNEAIQAKIVY